MSATISSTSLIILLAYKFDNWEVDLDYSPLVLLKCTLTKYFLNKETKVNTIVWNTAVVVMLSPNQVEKESTPKATGKAKKKPTPTSVIAS